MKQLLLLMVSAFFILQIRVTAQTASVTWPLNIDGTPTIVGNVSGATFDTNLTTSITGFASHSFADTSFKGLVVAASGFKSWPADSTTTTASADFSGLSTGVQRFIQFSMTPTSTDLLSIDNISVQLTESGSATNINAVVGYSTDGTNFTPINSSGLTGNPLPANTQLNINTIPTLKISSGTTLYVRIILWRKANSTASSSSVYISNVVVSGSYPQSNPAAAAIWNLTANGTAAITGKIVASTIDTATSTNIVGFIGHTFADTNFTGLIVGATGIKSWPADGSTTTANTTFTGISTGTERYIQFIVSPVSGNTFTVNNISVLLTESGSATNINTALGYTTDGTNFTTFNSAGLTGNALPANTTQTFTAAPAVTLKGDQQMIVRLILWRKANSTASSSSVYVGRVTISGTTSPVSGIASESLNAKGFAVFQNYPNPFNPSTVISYQLPTDNMVDVKVYNALGKEVATLAHEMQSSGMHSVSFNAGNLSSGTYYYRIQAGPNVKTGKMLLLK
jgi:hypothetical protein